MNITFTLIAQAISFALFIWFTARFVWPPLMKAIDERQKKIADGLSAAEQGNRSLKDAESRIQVIEREARAQAQNILAETDKRAGGLIEEAKGQARAEGGRQLAAAKAEIAQEVERAKAALREQVAALAVAGAEQILKREVNAQAHADLLTRLKAQL
ncbi:MAG TPA: F0F1 ATP synthase subunit B [Gammaproteobacteria bacterium]|nr:F0F1 ATP synthase subunit B [Gammaproteobacteria bacterium]